MLCYFVKERLVFLIINCFVICHCKLHTTCFEIVLEYEALWMLLCKKLSYNNDEYWNYVVGSYYLLLLHCNDRWCAAQQHRDTPDFYYYSSASFRPGKQLFLLVELRHLSGNHQKCLISSISKIFSADQKMGPSFSQAAQ